MGRAFIDYYSQNEISPVSQNITDLEKHFRRRGALYRSLGITPRYVAGRDVLEFGPGSGHNSIYTAHLKPAKYILVDGNPTGLHEAERLLANSGVNNLLLKLSLIEEYEDDSAYDLVLAEGFLAGQKFPEQIIDKITTFVRTGGIFVTTAQDSLSSVSDLLRMAVGKALRDPEIPLKEQAERLVPIFEPHFEKLIGMSRPILDWILDNVLQPILCKEYFSFVDVIKHLGNSFIFLGSSPHFVTDWRWYKDCIDDHLVNIKAAESYERNWHNMLDFQHVYPERDSIDNAALKQIADRLFKNCLAVTGMENIILFEAISEDLVLMAENLEQLGGCVAPTSQALRDAAYGFKNLSKRYDKVDFGSFIGFCGRGQQYLSLIKI